VLDPSTFWELLGKLLISHLMRLVGRALWPWVVRAFQPCIEFYRRVAAQWSRPAPEPLPVGTASAIATAMQPMPMPQTFVNNSHWMQWEAARHQHDLAAHFAMSATMPRFSNALNT
jgi:hypothetical protein